MGARLAFSFFLGTGSESEERVRERQNRETAGGAIGKALEKRTRIQQLTELATSNDSQYV